MDVQQITELFENWQTNHILFSESYWPDNREKFKNMIKSNKYREVSIEIIRMIKRGHSLTLNPTLSGLQPGCTELELVKKTRRL